MSYDKKRQLTDVDGIKVQQYYDKSSKTFKIQGEIATEKTVKDILNNLVGSSNTEEPPHLGKTVFLENEEDIYVKWFHDGLFYGTKQNEIYTSPDCIDWELVQSLDERLDIASLIVSDTGRIVVGCKSGYRLGELHRSDENGVFDGVPLFETGNFEAKFGHFKYRDFIWFNTYVENKGFDAGQKHEAFLSMDNGKTFKKIFDNDTLATLPELDDERFHLHDMDYDPYSGILYLFNGDFNNRDMSYSNDFGKTWKSLFPRGEVANCTQVIATKHGIMLGSDTFPGGFAFVPLDRSRTTQQDLPSIDKYIQDFWVIGKNNTDRYIAFRRWVERDKGLYLVPFSPENEFNNMSRIAISRDGYQWHELYKVDTQENWNGFQNVIYGNGHVVSTHLDKEGKLTIFKGELVL